ncbi:MAG: ATP-binding protein [Clostridia bacterium]|jgi:DNA replication protein DnaC|nr:ATP-binding protein [Clostridia bacterium]MDD4146417.1 ATP-binding protein [Clostridia bacterium]MDD4665469.1 ATP-binding protein [Clostridia bacterium]
MSLAGRALKRQQKLAEWETRVEALHKKYPRLGEISRSITKLSLETVLLGMGKGKMGMTWEELDQAREALQAEKTALFKEYNLPKNIDEVWWDCEKCGDRGFLGVGEKCACLLQEEREMRWEFSGLAPEQREQTINTFSLDWYEDQERYRLILQQCIEFAEKICAGEKTENLFLCGPIGTGKTHLCSAIANYVLQAGVDVVYLKIGTMLDLIREYKYNFEKSATFSAHRLKSLYHVSLLIIDDLGTEVSTDFVREQLFYLFDERINYRLPWVISTNLLPNEVGAMYEDRLSDRILGTSGILKFTGPSIRQLKIVRG